MPVILRTMWHLFKRVTGRKWRLVDLLESRNTVFMIQIVRAIESGQEFLVNYGTRYFDSDECLCANEKHKKSATAERAEAR